MIAKVFPHSIDPLIAEAKRRTRQRRVAVALIMVVIAGAALETTLALRPSAGAVPSGGPTGNESGLVLGSLHFLGKGFTNAAPQFGWGTTRPTEISMNGDSTGTVW